MLQLQLAMMGSNALAQYQAAMNAASQQQQAGLLGGLGSQYIPPRKKTYKDDIADIENQFLKYLSE